MSKKIKWLSDGGTLDGYLEQFVRVEPRRDWYCLECLEGWNNKEFNHNPESDEDSCPYCNSARIQELD